jgi:hypothetical protein
LEGFGAVAGDGALQQQLKGILDGGRMHTSIFAETGPFSQRLGQFGFGPGNLNHEDTKDAKNYKRANGGQDSLPSALGRPSS